MKGDFSRIRFNPAKLYTAVLKQQGRVDLDSDANEQCAIDVTLRETTNADLIGRYGGPVDGAGFEISVVDDEIWISAGRYYVEGILVEIPNRVHYDRQPYLVDPTHTAQQLLESLGQAGEGAALEFVLEVWQRMATALDDPCLLEPALNQADTTTRLQTVWRVVGTLETVSAENRIAKASEVRGRMGAAPAGGGSGCGCQPIPAAGYQGMENQLYRVEIHEPGDLTSATFKWSRENGSVVTKVTDVNGQTVTVTSLGPDANLGFQPGQWVELSDDTNQFAVPAPNQPGTLYQILSVDQAALQVTMTTAVTGLHKNRNARMRRWDQSGSTATASGIPVSSTPVPLENGIEVNFSKGQFEAGDYWTIPARTANGSIDWPPCGSDGKHFQPSSYMAVYEAPLACVSRVGIREGSPVGIQDYAIDLKTVVTDQRSFFPSLSASAIHIEEISWNNADLLTLDQFLANGLYVALDTAPTSPMDAAVFRVTLEIVTGSSYFQGEEITAEDRIDITKNNPNLGDLGSGGTSISTSGTASSTPQILIGPALRLEYVLDGIVSLKGLYEAGWIVIWNLPAGTDQTSLIYGLNRLLLNAYQSTAGANGQWTGIPAARVRVRLFGHMIFAQASREGFCGPVKTIYLDGQCFGTTSQLSDGSTGIALEEPSGNSAIASDFESWFYLAPAAQVASVTFDPNDLTLYAGAEGAAKGPSTLPSTGTVTLATPALSDTTINLTPSTQTGVTLTLSSTSIAFAAGQSSQTFTVTVQATSAAPNGPVTPTPTVTAAPQLEDVTLSNIFSSPGDLYVTVENPLAISTASLPDGIVGGAYTATLAATGGTPPYTWSPVPGAAGLPEALSLSAAGDISGKPGKSGEFPVDIQVTDSASPAATATKQFTLDVYAALEITTASPLPDGDYGNSYKTQLEATGGKSSYTWKATAGKTPTGLKLSSGGEISGKTDESGEFRFTIEVTDSADPPNHTTKNFELDVEAAPK